MFEHRPGVYMIVNKVDGKFYVGSSKDIQQRVWSHISAFKKGKHANKHMQNAWNLHGEHSFEFEVIEYVAEQRAIVEREQFYIDTLLPQYNFLKTAGYNADRRMPEESIAEMRKRLTGLKHTQETKNKIGDGHRGRKNSPDGIQNMRDAHANVPAETRKRMSNAKKGIEPVRATQAAAEANRDKERPQAVKDKISASKKGKPVKNQAAASKTGADKTRGKPRSEETSRKIAETVARKKELGLTKHSEATIAKIKAARQRK